MTLIADTDDDTPMLRVEDETIAAAARSAAVARPVRGAELAELIERLTEYEDHGPKDA